MDKQKYYYLYVTLQVLKRLNVDMQDFKKIQKLSEILMTA